MTSKLEKWNDAYQDADIASATPTQVLQDNAFLLPSSNQAVKPMRALDIACGRGGNAIFLANQGFEVDALDLSPKVLEKLSTFVKQADLPIHCLLGDLEANGLATLISPHKYDVIVVSYYLHRPIFKEITNALKSDGLLFYQTWSQMLVNADKGPSNLQFRLAKSELLSLTQPLIPVLYQELGVLGDTDQGLRNEAMLVAQKGE